MLLWAWSENLERLEAFKQAVESVGSRCRTFVDRTEFLARIPKVEPNLIVIDATSDLMAASHMTLEIRSLGLAQVPTIWFLGDRLEFEHGLCSEIGADDLVLTPYNMVELKARLGMQEKIVELEKELHDSMAKGTTSAQRLGELNELLNYASRRFQDLFERIPVACFSCDLEGRVFEWNLASERLYGYHAAEVMEKSIFDLVYGEDYVARFKETFAHVAAGGHIDAAEQLQRKKSGEPITVVMEVSEIKGQGGQTSALLFACNDITYRKRMEGQLENEILKAQEYALQLEVKQSELEHANAKLETLATTDGLTTLANNRSFRDRLASELDRATRYSTDFSLVLMDVDSFKMYNDSFGHPAGDAVLRQVAAILKEQVREVDLAARYGGEEFVVLLPEAGKTAAIKAAERIRKAIEAASWEHRPVTVSVGVATCFSLRPDQTDIVQAADEALYEAKRTGKNRVIHSADQTQPLQQAS